MNGVNLSLSRACKAFDGLHGLPVTGVKANFLLFPLIEEAVRDHESRISAHDLEEGRYFIRLPEEANVHVSGGVGLRTQNLEDYVVRMLDGRAEVFLKRKFAESTTWVSVGVFTFEAYKKSPRVSAEELANLADCTHVLASISPFSLCHGISPSSWTFISRLAEESKTDSMTGSEIRSRAAIFCKRNRDWTVVSD